MKKLTTKQSINQVILQFKIRRSKVSRFKIALIAPASIKFAVNEKESENLESNPRFIRWITPNWVIRVQS